MAEALNSLKPSMPITRTILNVYREMFGAGNYFQIAWRVIQCIAVNVVNMFIWCQLTTKKTFHHETMFWNIEALTNHDVTISILDVLARKHLCSDRFTIPTHKSIVVFTQTLTQRWLFAIINRADRIEISICFLCNQWIAASFPSFVMKKAISFACYAESITAVYGTMVCHAFYSFSIGLYHTLVIDASGVIYG